MKLYLTALLLIGCTVTETAKDNSNFTNEEVTNITDESLNRSVKSLDRTLKMMDKMIDDLDRMNNNLDEIFRAITDCKTSAECEALKEDYARQHEESKNQ